MPKRKRKIKLEEEAPKKKVEKKDAEKQLWRSEKERRDETKTPPKIDEKPYKTSLSPKDVNTLVMEFKTLKIEEKTQGLLQLVNLLSSLTDDGNSLKMMDTKIKSTRSTRNSTKSKATPDDNKNKAGTRRGGRGRKRRGD